MFYKINFRLKAIILENNVQFNKFATNPRQGHKTRSRNIVVRNSILKKFNKRSNLRSKRLQLSGDCRPSTASLHQFFFYLIGKCDHQCVYNKLSCGFVKVTEIRNC